MTTTVPRPTWRPNDDYDDTARWLDDADHGARWQAYGACRDANPELFFPVNVRELTGGRVVEEEPAYPPPDVKAICDGCPVRAVCLTRNVDEPYGIFGGTTGYQRGLLTKKIQRKHCIGCRSTDVVPNEVQKKEFCLACGLSWDII